MIMQGDAKDDGDDEEGDTYRHEHADVMERVRWMNVEHYVGRERESESTE